MNTDPFTYQVIRTYNLLSKRDIVHRFSTFVAAQKKAEILNEISFGTGMHYHVESKPRKAGK